MMTMLKAIVRPDKVDAVQNALDAAGIGGMTVTEVRGHGKQKGHSAVYRGKEYEITLLPKIAIDVVVPEEMAPAVINAIIGAARTGEIGDGRIFEMPVSRTYSIRTGELDPV
jgi:nitrogen regulatory protein P-II 2